MSHSQSTYQYRSDVIARAGDPSGHPIYIAQENGKIYEQLEVITSLLAKSGRRRVNHPTRYASLILMLWRNGLRYRVIPLYMMIYASERVESSQNSSRFSCEDLIEIGMVKMLSGEMGSLTELTNKAYTELEKTKCQSTAIPTRAAIQKFQRNERAEARNAIRDRNPN